MTEFLKPKTLWKRFISSEFPYDLAVAIVAVGTGSLSATRELLQEDPNRGLAGALIVIAVVGAVISVLRGWSRFNKENGTRELHALDGAIQLLYAVLTSGVPEKHNGHDLRICVFVPHTSKTVTVHQITDYVHNGKPYGRSRDLSSRCGVVGLAFRSGEAKYAYLPNGMNVAEYLVAAYGFAMEEAAAMRRDRKSWVAVPVGTPGRVIAVIYLDSAIRDFFGNSNGPKRKIIEAATIGVAKFVERA